MPPKLRPRRQLPPSDHNYAKSLTHLPVYSENSWPVILSGPNGIFEKDSLLLGPQVSIEEQKSAEEDKLLEAVKEEEKGAAEESTETPVLVKVIRKRSRSTTSEGDGVTCGVDSGNRGDKAGGAPPKKKRRKFFKGTTYEPKRRRKKRTATENSQGQNGDLGRNVAFGFENSSIDDVDPPVGIYGELDLRTNRVKVDRPGEHTTLNDGDILLNPSANADDVPGLYNPSFVGSGGATSDVPPQPLPPAPPPAPSTGGRMKRICTSCTNECQWRRKRCSSLPPESDSRRQSERLIKLNYKFPFEDLPDVCKLKIFSYLKPCDKGKAAQVCHEWSRLMRSPGLWAHMNFAAFNPTSMSTIKYKPFRGAKTSPMTSSFHGQFPWFSTYVEYEEYKSRVFKFLTCMQDIKPKLKSLTFAYDVGEPKDDWLAWISNFLDKSQCQDLTYADVDWTWTPLRLSCTDRYCCLFNKMQIKYRMHEKRVKHFNRLQVVLAKNAPKLAHLKIPFDWSARSVLLMCRMKQVRTLQLGQYMMLRGVQQEMIDMLLRNMPQLRELEIKVCSPYHNFTTTYSIKHNGLQSLDISLCKGFYVHDLQCPQLTTLKLGRYPWKGPIVNKETNRLPCMYTLCKKGTPRLAYINRHHIQPYWVEFLYDELNTVLCKVCSCKDHLYRETAVAAAPVAVGDDDPGAEDPSNHHGNQGNNAQAPPPPYGAAVNFVPNAQQALDLLNNVKANIVPLFPLLHQDDDMAAAPQLQQPAENPVPSTSKCVMDNAVPSTSYTALPSTSRGPSIPVSSKGKSCSRFKAKRSRPAPEVEPSEASDNEDIIPIDHPTVEVRSTPRVNTFPFLGSPTHVAVIPIRVVDQRSAAVPAAGGAVPGTALSAVPMAIQSIALQPQIIGVDTLTGAHVFSGPLTVIKHVIQVVPKPLDSTSAGSTPSLTPVTMSPIPAINTPTITPVTMSAIPAVHVGVQASLQTVNLDVPTPGGGLEGSGVVQSSGMQTAGEPVISVVTSPQPLNLCTTNHGQGAFAATAVPLTSVMATGGFATCNADADLVTVSMEETERVEEEGENSTPVKKTSSKPTQFWKGLQASTVESLVGDCAGEESRITNVDEAKAESVAEDWGKTAAQSAKNSDENSC